MMNLLLLRAMSRRPTPLAAVLFGLLMGACTEPTSTVTEPPGTSSAAATPGGELAFVRNGAVFVSRLDGSAPIQLQPEATQPAWSPDGTRIAFTRPTNGLDKWQLCIAWEDGTDVQCVIGKRDGEVRGGPSWSPDGGTVAFSLFIHDCPNGECDSLGGFFSGLMLLNTLSMSLDPTHPLPGDTLPLTSVSWSPQGGKIMFTSFGGGTFGQWQLGTMNRDGSGPIYLRKSYWPYTVDEVVWSPDGRKLALSLHDENACPWHCDTAIGIVNADGTDLKVLARGYTPQSWVGAPTWSPDGTVVAYTRIHGDDCLSSNYACGSDIMVTGVDGVGTKVMLAGGGLPAWRR